VDVYADGGAPALERPLGTLLGRATQAEPMQPAVWRAVGRYHQARRQAADAVAAYTRMLRTAIHAEHRWSTDLSARELASEAATALADAATACATDPTVGTALALVRAAHEHLLATAPDAPECADLAVAEARLDRAHVPSM
jgi:hypothetical protein